MPSYGIHLIILDEVVDKLRADGHAQEANLLQTYGDYASLGAMGPDIYFFAPDMSPGVRDFVNFVFDVYDILEPFIDFYESCVAPIEEAINEGVDRLTGGLWAELQKTITQMEGVITALLTRLVTNNLDLFQFFEPNMNQGKLEKDWFWIEMGHGRRTGEYACRLLEMSVGDDPLRAYAYGYMTHIVGDVVGHPYVNQIVGGPFRTHWHRHHLVENFMDVWAWDHYKKANILEANLHRRMDFGSGDLDKDLANLIDRASRATYTDPAPHIPERLGPQNYLSTKEIHETYILFRKFLETATSRGIMSLPKPVPPQVIPGLGSTVTAPPSSSGGGFSWSALWNWIKWLFKTAFKIVTLPLHVLASLTTYQVRYLLYEVQLLLYQAYRALREALVLGGYIMCEPDDLNGKHALEYTRQRQPAPALRFENQGYPFPLKECPYTQTPQHQLVYPPHNYPQDVEFYMTESSPYPVGATPDVFIEKALCHPAADALASAKSPVETQQIDKNTLQAGKGQLGSAVDWAARLIVKAHTGQLNMPDDLPDWNLDGDRGYGWLNWYWEPYDQPLNPQTPDVSEVKYFPGAKDE